MTYPQIIGLLILVPVSLLCACILAIFLIGSICETNYQIKELRKQTNLAWNKELPVKIKLLHPDAVIPKYAHIGDAGLDLVAVSMERDEHGNLVYGTGLAFEIPDGYYMQLTPRSSNHKTSLVLSNHLGVVDSGYRGEVFFKFAEYDRKRDYSVGWEELPKEPPIYQAGDRIGQLIILPYPIVKFEESVELSESERGTGAYGSTGK